MYVLTIAHIILRGRANLLLLYVHGSLCIKKVFDMCVCVLLRMVTSVVYVYEAQGRWTGTV